MVINAQKLAHIPVITMDGPSGTGKGTISHRLAHYLGWHYLDSGAIYRVLAWAAKNNHVGYSDIDALIALAQNLHLSFEIDVNLQSRTLLDLQDISAFIRTETCGQDASKIAVIPEVRIALLEKQRAFVKSPGLVTDGRDMGTVVFPEADLKLYLFASIEERASRRLSQLQNTLDHDSLTLVIDQLMERDARDSQRAFSPLMPAVDAIQIDTTSMSIEAVFSRVLDIVSHRMALAID